MGWAFSCIGRGANRCSPRCGVESFSRRRPPAKSTPSVLPVQIVDRLWPHAGITSTGGSQGKAFFRRTRQGGAHRTTSQATIGLWAALRKRPARLFLQQHRPGGMGRCLGAPRPSTLRASACRANSPRATTANERTAPSRSRPDWSNATTKLSRHGLGADQSDKVAPSVRCSRSAWV